MSLTGSQIRKYRECHDVTLLEVAFAVGVPPQAVEEMENDNPGFRCHLLPALNAVQALSRQREGVESDRLWVSELTTQGISRR